MISHFQDIRLSEIVIILLEVSKEKKEKKNKFNKILTATIISFFKLNALSLAKLRAFYFTYLSTTAGT